MNIFPLRALSSSDGSGLSAMNILALRPKPRYMSKRPRLTIKIPGQEEAEPVGRLVSCFSPFSDDGSLTSEDPLSPGDNTEINDRKTDSQKVETRLDECKQAADRKNWPSALSDRWPAHRRNYSIPTDAHESRLPSSRVLPMKRLSLLHASPSPLSSPTASPMLCCRDGIGFFDRWHLRSTTC